MVDGGRRDDKEVFPFRSGVTGYWVAGWYGVRWLVVGGTTSVQPQPFDTSSGSVFLPHCD